ncbi:Folylpolyglutamate synthetase, partial [Metarhizium majus ARSEF 297]
MAGGYADLSILRPIHITGTKGKGSTATFTESLLRSHFNRLSLPFKSGLYTSPHVINERDRIRIDSEPVSEDLFTAAFFDIWQNLDLDGDNEEFKPGYLQLLTLLSVHIFIKEEVDVAVYEVHAGGRKDATNIFDQPVACGITEIGLDHADLLGPNIESIVWHKSGIMKCGTPTYSVIQRTKTANMLKREAEKIGSPLEFVDVFEPLPEHPNISQLVQRGNFSLAMQLASDYLSNSGHQLVPDDVELAVQAKLPGRFRLRTGSINWLLDSAHNYLSLPIALSWFQSETQTDRMETNTLAPQRALIFGHVSHRNTEDLIDIIMDHCAKAHIRFDHFILASYHRYGDEMPNSTVRNQLNFWRSRKPEAEPRQATTTEEAISMVKDMQQEYPGGRFEVLITGSNHLVGEAVRALEEE